MKHTWCNKLIRPQHFSV